MRHRKQKAKMGVKSQHRIALLRNLVRSLVIHKRIETTVLKAKQASSFSDKMVQLGKRGDLHARRLLISKLGCPATADALIKVIAPQFKDRNGGYTRVLKLGNRPGDNAQKAILEFTAVFEDPEKKAKKKAASKSSTAAKEIKSEAEDPNVKVDDKQQDDGKKGGFLGTLRKFLKSDES